MSSLSHPEGYYLFNEAVWEVLEDITGDSLSDWAWMKANLPWGVNFWFAVLHTPPTTLMMASAILTISYLAHQLASSLVGL